MTSEPPTTAAAAGRGGALHWQDFADMEPELARFGEERLTVAPAYLATVRPSGRPRVHPVTPILSPPGLFLFMEPTSPKGRDLGDGRGYALHNGVPDDAGSGGEFSVSGFGVAVEDPDVWNRVADSASYAPADRYVLFELLIGEARCQGYGDVDLPATRRWTAGA